MFKFSHSLIHNEAQASLGMRQSPRGDNPTMPTFGPSGKHERLNCCEKNRRQNVVSHFLIVALSYSSANASLARIYIFEGENP